MSMVWVLCLVTHVWKSFKLLEQTFDEFFFKCVLYVSGQSSEYPTIDQEYLPALPKAYTLFSIKTFSLFCYNRVIVYLKSC